MSIGIGLGYVRGGASDASLAPETDWRLAISAVTDSTGNATDIAGILASDTNKDNYPFTVAVSTTRTIGMSVAATPNGGMIYYDVTGSSTNWTVTAEHSFDSTNGTDGTWTAITHSPWRPVGMSGNSIDYAGRGQAVVLSADVRARWVRVAFANSDASNTMSVTIGAFKFAGFGKRNDLTLMPGMSITIQDSPARIMRRRVQKLYPNRDPIFINMGYPGANWGTIRTSCLQPFIGSLPWGYAILDPGPNGLTRPYSTDPGIAGLTADIAGCVSDLKAAVNVVFCAGMDYMNFTTPDVNGLLNQENGSKPYNDGIVYPEIEANLASTSWDAAYDVPQGDEYTSIAINYEAALYSGTAPDGRHPQPTGYPTHVRTFDNFQKHIMSSSKENLLAAKVQSAATHTCRAGYKTRLQAMLDAWPSTSTATAARTALSSQISAISTTYADNPNATLSSGLVASLAAWWSARKFDTLTLAANTRLGISSWVDRVAAYDAVQATTNNQPVYYDNEYNGCGIVRGAHPMLLQHTGTAKGLLDAAGQQFMAFAVVELYTINAAGGLIFSFGQSTSNKLGLNTTGAQADGGLTCVFFGATSGVPAGTTLISGTTRLKMWTPYVVSLLYDGTTAYLRINGVQEGSAAWAKPAWTADKLNLLANASGTGTQAGLGDFKLRTSYNLTDAQAIEAQMMAEWGIL